MTIQNTLNFPIPRKAQRDRAEQRADPVVMERYERVLTSAGSGLGVFIAAEITEQYEKRYGKLSERDAKGLGGLYARLLLRGTIVKTKVWRPRKNGCPQAEYEWKGL
jgi:hypothetical protein